MGEQAMPFTKRFFDFCPNDKELIYLFRSTSVDKIKRAIGADAEEMTLTEKENIISLCEYRGDYGYINEVFKYLDKHDPETAFLLSRL